MNLNSPLFNRIRTRRIEADEPAPGQGPRCDHAGCAAAGAHRAPKGRLREGEYYNFCLDHVRAYNQAYNYFNGMSDNAVEAFQKDALTGHRPTWTVGVNAKGAAAADSGIPLDPLGLFTGRPGFRRSAPPPPEKRSLGKAALKALETLGLDEQADKDAVRGQFKRLAKRLHPDLNGGDRSSEDKLRAIIDAYNYLKSVNLA